MSGTYKATGINLKGMAFGESDRLITVLTREFGLVRAIAPGSRKHQSSLRGRSGLFVVNDLLIAKGRSLDKIIQAEGLESFPGLSQDLRKLTASQYLAELTLYQALSDQPQEELFLLLRNSLSRLEQLPAPQAIECLLHATFQLLTLAGVAPQVHACCVTQAAIEPNWSDPTWRTGFSVAAGGTVTLAELDRLTALPVRTAGSQPTIDSRVTSRVDSGEDSWTRTAAEPPSITRVAEPSPTYRNAAKSASAKSVSAKSTPLCLELDAAELALLQQLAEPDATDASSIDPMLQPFDRPPPDDPIWLATERLLRHCAEYYFDRPIRSAALIDSCFQPFVFSHSPSPLSP